MRFATLINITRSLLLLVGIVVLGITGVAVALDGQPMPRLARVSAPQRTSLRPVATSDEVVFRSGNDHCAGCAARLPRVAHRRAASRSAMSDPIAGASGREVPNAEHAVATLSALPAPAGSAAAELPAAHAAGAVEGTAGGSLHRCRMRISPQGLAKLRALLGDMLPDVLYRGGGEVELRARGHRLGSLCMPLEGAKLARLGDRLERYGIARDVIRPSDVVSSGAEMVVIPERAQGGVLAALLAAVHDKEGVARAERATVPRVAVLHGASAASRRQIVESL